MTFLEIIAALLGLHALQVALVFVESYGLDWRAWIAEALRGRIVKGGE